jgi:hypothetical protein
MTQEPEAAPEPQHPVAPDPVQERPAEPEPVLVNEQAPRRTPRPRPPSNDPRHWHFERTDHGVTYEYPLVEWLVRVVFLLAGLVIGWITAHGHV